jgi:hypothetical protein
VLQNFQSSTNCTIKIASNDAEINNTMIDILYFILFIWSVKNDRKTSSPSKC